MSDSGVIERIKYCLACWWLDSPLVGSVRQYVYERDARASAGRSEVCWRDEHDACMLPGCRCACHV